MTNKVEPSHFESLYPPDSRFPEIEKLLKFAKEGNSVQLVGLPGVGRSNLLGFLSYNKNIRKKHLGQNQKWFHFVYVNFSEIRNRPLSDATKFIFLCLLGSLHERKMFWTKDSEFAAEDAYDEVDKIFKEAVSSNDELVLFAGLKKAIDYLCIKRELTIVFLFDRFEEYIPVLINEFFANLRVLRNRAKYRFSVVFSLGRTLEDLIEPVMFSDFHEFIADNIVYLSLSDKPGLDFRISYLEKVSGKQFDHSTIQTIISLTGGHGKLTRLCLEAILANSDLQLATRENLVSYFLNLKSIRGALYEIWSSLLPEEQQRLKTKKLPSTSEVTGGAPRRWVENVGLVQNGKITIPLFEKYIAAIEQFSNEAISFNPQTNEIKRGDIILSESLTSSEFKLLKFLLENKDKVIQRDEMVNAVWKEDKTTEGVTDQALDQLIFRLRKKIEKDPNNPSHLQTIKGRGIRFTS